jgi:hypothetical protein
VHGLSSSQVNEVDLLLQTDTSIHRASDSLSWINRVAGGSWRLGIDVRVQVGGEPAWQHVATAAARGAIAEALEPLLHDAEEDYQAAVRERDRIVRGR